MYPNPQDIQHQQRILTGSRADGWLSHVTAGTAVVTVHHVVGYGDNRSHTRAGRQDGGNLCILLQDEHLYECEYANVRMCIYTIKLVAFCCFLIWDFLPHVIYMSQNQNILQYSNHVIFLIICNFFYLETHFFLVSKHRCLQVILAPFCFIVNQ